MTFKNYITKHGNLKINYALMPDSKSGLVSKTIIFGNSKYQIYLHQNEIEIYSFETESKIDSFEGSFKDNILFFLGILDKNNGEDATIGLLQLFKEVDNET